MPGLMGYYQGRKIVTFTTSTWPGKSHLLHAGGGKGQLQTLVQHGGEALESVKYEKSVVGGRGLLEGSSRDARGSH